MKHPNRRPTPSRLPDSGRDADPHGVASETPRRNPSWPRLRERMDALVGAFGPEHLTPDPLEVVRRYSARDDVEVAGFLGAALAFGSARGAVRSVSDILARMAGPAGLAPGAAARSWDAARDVARLRGWRHRWLGPDDAAAVVHVLGRMLREHGSIESFLVAGDDRSADVRAALESFCSRALALSPSPMPPRVGYWFAGPAKGGSAKRLNLFLRWMCRRDQLDPGPWTSVAPSRLVIPLDVHVARISRYVGLLRRRTSDWRAALEITEHLRRFAPDDPVKYDYALCRLGILGTCPRRRERRKCATCPLYDVCLL